MTTKEYLEEVLVLQKLSDDSQELKDLQKHRAEVEQVLTQAFFESNPSIRYGGSKAKGTLIKEAYDLDIICYFESGDTRPGESLKEIYDNVLKALAKKYTVVPKNSSLRLYNLDSKAGHRDFHVDVVPGRYTDNTKGDCFIHQNNADKERMKTNLNIHIAHVKDSGLSDGIRLLKLWKVRKGINLKQFVWELLVIKILKAKKSSSLEDQLKHVWKTIQDTTEPIAVKDPANENGNDLSAIVKELWPTLQHWSRSTLVAIESSGWEAVFGSVKKAESQASRIANLKQAAATAPMVSRPWSD